MQQQPGTKHSIYPSVVGKHVHVGDNEMADRTVTNCEAYLTKEGRQGQQTTRSTAAAGMTIVIEPAHRPGAMQVIPGPLASLKDNNNSYARLWLALIPPFNHDGLKEQLELELGNQHQEDSSVTWSK
jgi:hypothetical protein